ncbi:MAG: hypothetical protein OXF48_11400 [Bacteroidetes bacterium]|nr:hypothetical protein [Bacteroidota bacterium]
MTGPTGVGKSYISCALAHDPERVAAWEQGLV